MTPQEVAELASLRAKYGTASYSPESDVPAPGSDQGFFPRFGERLANIPGNVVSGLVTAGNQFFGDGQAAADGYTKVPDVFNIPDAQNWQQQGADLAGGVAQVVAESLIPGGAVTRGARLLGAGARTAAILGDVGAGAYLGAQHGSEEAAAMGAEFGGMGAISQFLPGGGVGRALLRGGLNAAIPLASSAIRGEDPLTKENAISAGAMAVLGSGVLGAAGKRLMKRKVVEAPPIEAEGYPQNPVPGPDDRFALPGPTVAPEARTWRQLPDGPQNPNTAFVMGEGTAPRPLIRRPEPFIEGEFRRVDEPLQLPAPLLSKAESLPTKDTAAAPAQTGAAADPQQRMTERLADFERRSRTLGDAMNSGDIVTFNGQRGKLVPGEDGIYFRKVMSREQQRVFGNAPEASIADVEGLGLHKQAKAAPVEVEPPFERQQFGARNRQQFGQAGSTDLEANPLTRFAPQIIGAAAGATTDDENRLRGAAIGALGGASLPRAGRQLLRTLRNPRAAIAEEQKLGVLPAGLKRLLPKQEAKLEAAAQAQERGEKTLLGGAVRRYERDFAGPSAEVQGALERGKGFQAVQLEAIQAANQKFEGLVKTATPAQLDQVQAFKNGPKLPSDEATLRRAIGDEPAKGFIEAVRSQEAMQLAHGEADPLKRGDMILDTLGTHTTRAFKAFVDPENWKPTEAQTKAVSDLFAKLPENQGKDPWQISRDVANYRAEKLGSANGGKLSPGSARIEATLFKSRKDLSPEIRAFLGEITNPLEAQIATNAKLANTAHKAKSIAEVSNLKDADGHGLVMSDIELRDAVRAAEAKGDTATANKLKAYQPFPESPGFGAMAGKNTPREVIDAFDAHGEGMKASNGFFNTHINSLFKKSMTAWNPGSHARQWIGVYQQGALARVMNPVHYVNAAKALVDNGDVRRKMVKLGIIGADYSTHELNKDLQRAGDLLNPKKKGILGKVNDAVSKAYGLPDSIARTGAYLANEPRFIQQGMKKGLSGPALATYAENATQAFVNRYTPNFGSASNAVKWGRTAPLMNPFLTYTAEMARIMKNLGEDVISSKSTSADRTWAVFGLTHLAAVPLALAAAGEAALSAKDREDWSKVDKLSPEYIRSQIKIPTGRNKDGSFRYFSMGPISPAGDFVSMARSLARGDMSAAMSSNPLIGIDKTPILNLAANQIFGQDHVTKEPLNTPLARAKNVAKGLLPPLTPGVGSDWNRGVNAFTPNQSGGLGVTDARTGRRDTPADSGRALIGLRTSSIQPRSLIANKKREMTDAITQAKSDLHRVLRTDAAEPVKAKARALFRRKQQEAVTDYRKIMATVRG